jgi:Ni/Fe-hydrogenase subunit HybB-like protein
MQTDSTLQATGSGYATQKATKAPNWHGVVILDVLLNGLTNGLFLTAGLADLAAPQTFAAVARAAYPVALVLLFADLVCLVIDLGDPLRFHHMLRVFKPSSPMSLGVWCLTLYSLPLTLIVVLDLLPAGGPALDWVRRVAVVVGLVPALGSVVYKGVLFSTSSQPVWKEARWLGGYLTTSAFTLGCAEMLVLALLLGQSRATALLRPALVVVLVLGAIPLGLLIADVHPALIRICSDSQLQRRGGLSLGGGVLIPLCLLLVGGSPAVLLTAVVFIILGNLASRFVIVHVPHEAR